LVLWVARSAPAWVVSAGLQVGATLSAQDCAPVGLEPLLAKHFPSLWCPGPPPELVGVGTSSSSKSPVESPIRPLRAFAWLGGLGLFLPPLKGKDTMFDPIDDVKRVDAEAFVASCGTDEARLIMTD
jgi:hypothetical protein